MLDADMTSEGSGPAPPAFLEHNIPREGHYLYAREYTRTGPTFVVLHGFPDNLHIYDRLISVLNAAGRHVVAFDFLGFGASGKPTDYEYSFEQQLGDLIAVTDVLKLKQVIPVGHDAGGVAAIDFALSQRERVTGLCLLNTFYGSAPTLRLPELIELFTVPGLAALADTMASTPGQMASLVQFQQSQFKLGASAAQIDVFDNVLQPIINDNFSQQPGAGPAFAKLTRKLTSQISRNDGRWAQIEGLDFPVTIIWGEKDAYLATGVAKDFASWLRGSSLHLLDAAHWPQLDCPEEVGAHMMEDLWLELRSDKLGLFGVGKLYWSVQCN